METYFASAKRIGEKELEKEIECICNNPIIDGLMNVSSGLMTVLNEHRQIVALTKLISNCWALIIAMRFLDFEWERL